jgi:hypothetical protein
VRPTADHPDGVGLGQPAGPPLRGRSLRRNLTGVEAGGDQGDRDVRRPVAPKVGRLTSGRSSAD